MAFSPDGRGLVAGSGSGEIYGWELPSGKPLFEPVRSAHTSDIWGFAFSPKGDRFATYSSDGTSVLLEYPSGRIIGRAFGDVSDIAGVAFTPDGTGLIAAAPMAPSGSGDIDKQTLIATTPSGHSQPIIDVAESADGKLVATLGNDQQYDCGASRANTRWRTYGMSRGIRPKAWRSARTVASWRGRRCRRGAVVELRRRRGSASADGP
jgi:WD40 repeat protein